MSEQELATVERILASVWKDVLERSEEVSGSDRFFELGGDSVSMMMMLFKVEQALHVEITPEQMFANDSFEVMVANIEALGASLAG